MNSIKVALLQLMPEENLQGNIEKGIRAIEKSAMMGADIALFLKCGAVDTIFRRTRMFCENLL